MDSQALRLPALLPRVYQQTVRAGGQAERFGSEASDSLAVHGQLGGASGRCDVHPGGLKLNQSRRRNGFYFGHHQVRLFVGNDLAETVAIEHRTHMTTMGDLHRRRIAIAITSDDFIAKSLEFDGDFFTEFARSRRSTRVAPGLNGVPIVIRRYSKEMCRSV